MEIIHHGSEKRTCRRGADGVGFILIEEAVENLTRGGLIVERGGFSTEERRDFYQFN
jgi:hypothetical protein